MCTSLNWLCYTNAHTCTCTRYQDQIIVLTIRLPLKNLITRTTPTGYLSASAHEEVRNILLFLYQPVEELDITAAVALVVGEDCFRRRASLKHLEHIPSLDELP